MSTQAVDMSLRPRLRIVEEVATNEGVELPNDVALHLANAIEVYPSQRDLNATLIRVIAYASLISEPITLELVRDSWWGS